MLVFDKLPFLRQADEMDCGPTCLRIIASYYGKKYSSEYLRIMSYTDREGSSLLNISQAAERIGFKTFSAKAKLENLDSQSGILPFICYWKNKHFVVVYKINEKYVWVCDPASGKIRYSRNDFLKHWNNGESWGIALFLSPTSSFKTLSEPRPSKDTRRGFSLILKNAANYKKLIFQIFLGLVSTSLLQLTLPFLTQNIVDRGITTGNLSFIKLILLAQLTLFAGRIIVEVIRTRLLLHLSSRLGINLLVQFVLKLMKLPIAYYDRKRPGDILQRINDHTRVETFITSGALGFAYSIVTIVVFFIVLFIYSKTILLIFLAGSIIYFGWIQIFTKKRASIDQMKFDILSTANDKNLEILTGMQEIKLNNAEFKKKTEWEDIQIEQFDVNLRSLTLRQIQIDGATVINELKNLIITFAAATLVINGQLTLGMMLSISFITGQLNVPITTITQFLQDLQDARLSMNRINEIHNMKEESSASDLNYFPSSVNCKEGLKIENLRFKYSRSPSHPFVLNNVSLSIPKNRVTAIVGSSGSGKTTLMKLLLKIYEPFDGNIYIGGSELYNISHAAWRAKVGVVMQEGFIFNDTIANNIIMGDSITDQNKLIEATKIANIYDFIFGLPLKFNTKIGLTGIGLSTGQKQRILIARAVYKNPEILFFDEATSALDANNEKAIMANLKEFFKGRTVFIIAHRLSTVVQADQIVVLEQGQIVENGSHRDLVDKRGNYFNLIRNQLELGQ